MAGRDRLDGRRRQGGSVHRGSSRTIPHALRWRAALAGGVLVAGLVTVAVGAHPVEAASVPAAGTVYIPDYPNILVVPPGGAPTTTIGTGLTDAFQTAVDASGDVFVADGDTNQVVEIPAGGGPQTTIGTGLKDPDGVAVDAAGDVFISDPGADSVVEVPAGGGSQTTVATGFGRPQDVAVDGAGDLYVADSDDDRVVEIPANGGPQTTVFRSHAGSDSVVGLAVDAGGNLYIDDSEADDVVEVPAGGAPQRLIGTNFHLDSPLGVAVGTNGDVFIADTFNNRVLEVASGKCTDTRVAHVSEPFGVAVYPPANVSATAKATATAPGAAGARYDPVPPPVPGQAADAGTTPRTTGAGTVTGTAGAGTARSTEPTAEVGAGQEPRPVVQRTYPDLGPVTGGQQITIYGSGFLPGATVEIGQGDGAGPTAIPATDVDVASKTRIVATTGGGAKVGKFFHVFVVTSGGTSTADRFATYAYHGIPTVASISPDSGAATGCQNITVTGTKFPVGATVEVGQGSGPGADTVPAIDVDVVSPTLITATTGGHARPGGYYLFVSFSGGPPSAHPQENRDSAYTYTASG